MTTHYYCKNCDATFSEAHIPNMNKSHFCGELARVVEFFDDGGTGGKEESAPHH